VLPSRSVFTSDTAVYFIQPNITNLDFSSEGFTICTHTTSLTFDLSHRIRKNYQGIEEKNLSRGEKKGKKMFRRATEEDLSPAWREATDVTCTVTHT